MRQEVGQRLQRLANLAAGRADDSPLSAEPGSRLASLGVAFGLSMVEIDTLCAVIGGTLVPELAQRLGERPTLARVLTLLVPDLGERLAVVAGGFPSGLVAAGLLRPLRSSSPDAELVPTRRARAALLGAHMLDALPRFARRIGRGQEVSFDVDVARVAETLRQPRGSLLVCAGPPGMGKSTFLRAVADRLAPEHLSVDVALAAATLPAPDLGLALAELVTDATLAGVPIVLDPIGEHTLAKHPAAVAELVSALGRGTARVLIAVDQLDELPGSLTGRASRVVELKAPSHELRGRIWREALRDACSAAELADVAESFTLTPRQIVEAAAGWRPERPLREAATGQLEGEAGLVEATTARRGLDRLILSDGTREQIDELVAAIRGRQTLLHDGGLRGHLSRGRGLSAMFDGEPGTGKTAACEAIAVETGYPLARVNLATIVDKYVGETEKNLMRAFAQAKARGSILLFDEADSLFAKRTSVHGASERYANLEVNLLLQLMEEHTGVVFLTTNLKTNLDPAFMRRITFKIEMERPDALLRAEIWARALPVHLLDDDVRFNELADAYPLAGGSIQAAAMRAAYLATGARRRVTHEDLFACAERECAAAGVVVQTIRRVA